MKIYKKFAKILGFFSLVSYLFAVPALVPVYAANIPSMSLYAPTAGSSQVQITVFGADPNASVLLYYPSTSSLASTNIGTTNSSGYLTTTVDANTYGITSGASVYAMVDGQASASSVWPSYTSSGSLPLSQSVLIMNSGQSQVVSASVSAALTLSTNSNPSVATASISGNQITVTAFNTGSTNLTICATGLGCSTIAVTVQASGTSSSNISFSQSTVTVGVGQSQTVAINGSGNYYVSANSNSGFVSASLSGAILTVGGINAGSSNITICSSANSGTTCAMVTVTVSPSTTSTVTNTTQIPLTFTPSNINLNIGQSQSVTINGGAGGFYVSTNSSPSTAGANVNGTSVTVVGVAFGGDNITICSVNGQCGILYAYVSSAVTSPTTSTVTTTAAPAITSFSVSSNDRNGSFLGSGNALTIGFSTNQSISVPSVTVAGAAVSVVGNGNGPYTANYAVTGNETLPIPVKVTFSNPAGSSATTYFWLGANGTGLSQTTPTTSTVTSSSGTTSSTGTVFTEYLYNGSADAQVTALQRRLTADGVYSGPITGTFGNLTEAGVKAYQKKHGLDQLGVVGPATRALLNEGI